MNHLPTTVILVQKGPGKFIKENFADWLARQKRRFKKKDPVNLQRRLY